MGEAALEVKEVEQQWFTTAQAAKLIGKTPKALKHAVLRGTIVPDGRGQRGRHRSHMFSRKTLDAYVLGSDND